MPFYIFIFFLLILAFFDKALSGRLIFIERDLAGFFIPPKYLWVTLVKNFQLPLWNPYNYSGIPLLATLQPGIFYPPHLFYLVLPFPIVWNWLIILHFVFAGTTVFLFLRYLKASNSGAFAGGVVFMLSGYLLSVHNLMPHLFSVSWFPLVVMFFLKYLESLRPKYLAFASICLVMEFFAGAPEIVMMTFFVLLLIMLFYPLFTEGNHLNLFKRCWALFIVSAFFVLISSIQLIPFLELSYHSIRKHGLSYQEAITWSFAWKDFIQFFLPNLYGYFHSDAKYWTNQSWLKTVYLGIAPFILSIFYFITEDKKRYFFLGIMVLSFLFALGSNTPVYKILFYIPPFNSVRYPVKFLFLFFFLISVTSGFGFDRLKQGIYEKDLKTQKVIKIIFYTGFIFAIAWGFVNIFNAEVKDLFEKYNIKPDAFNEIDFNIHNIKRFLLFSFLFCVMLLVSMRIKYKKTAFFGLITILTADLFFANYGYYKLTDWNEYIKKNTFVEKIKNEETERYIVTPLTRNKFKVYPEDKVILGSAYAAIYGLFTESGMEVVRLADYEIFSNMLYETGSIKEAKRFFDISGIGYVISIKEIAEEDFELIDRLNVKIEGAKKGQKETEEIVVKLYKYKDSPGRFIFYNKAISVKDSDTAIKVMEDKSIDLRSNVIIIDPDGGFLRPEVNPSIEKAKRHQDKISILSYTPNKIILRCETEKDSYLYITDTFYPGWKAYIDGKKTEIYKANLAFRAVYMPKGSHTVVFRYMPLSFLSSIIFTFIGIFLLFFFVKRFKL